jgi:hypothetical protein
MHDLGSIRFPPEGIQRVFLAQKVPGVADRIDGTDLALSEGADSGGSLLIIQIRLRISLVPAILRVFIISTAERATGWEQII